MRSVLMLAGMAVAASSASASVMLESGPLPMRSVQAFDESTLPNFQNRVVTRNYDNWTNPPSALLGFVTSGSDEIADLLNMTPVAGVGRLSNLGINVANVNSPSGSAFTGGSVIIRFYDGGSGTFINGFNANLPALNLAAGGSTRLSFGPGSLEGLNISLPQNVFVSLQYGTNVTFSGTGASVANLGFQLRSPASIGSSPDGLLNVTTNTAITFGGNPPANTGLFVETNDIPAPGAFALLGLGGLVAARRRR